MRINEIEAMRAFVQVVEAGSFSAAAQAMGVGQPSISRRISALEEELGVSLLVRTTRSLSPTEAGARYHEAAVQALAAVEQSRRAATDAASMVRGRLRVAAPGSFTRCWLGPRLPEFIERHPDVELHLQLSERHIDLVAEAMDLGVRIGGPDRAELRGRRLGPVHRRVVASPTWVDRHGRPESVHDLTRLRGLVFSGQANWKGWPLREGSKTIWVRPERILSATSGDVLRVLTLAGEGFSILPDWLIADDIEAGRLVPLLSPDTAPGFDAWIVWPSHVFPTATARAFRGWIQQAWAHDSTSGATPRDSHVARFHHNPGSSA